MSMKICKDCGTEVSKSAKTCPKCGKKLKHAGLRIVLGIIIIVIGFGMLVNDTNNTNTEPTSSTSAKSESVVTKSNYDKIKKGMTKEEVKQILGEPASVSENETPGVGTMELNHYQEGFEFKGIDIYYLNGKVYMKNWTEL